MENNILREIIDVEKEIQQSLDQAKINSHEWLDARKREIESNMARQEQDILQSFERAREQAAQEAAQIGSQLFEQAKQQADRLAHLENDLLVKIVTSHINKILPG
jgi:vacuolar-type H+-ATPase subunit H